jgi:hypothetical protein
MSGARDHRHAARFPGARGFGESLGNDVSLLRRTIAPTRRLLDAARAVGLMVIHTREGHRADLADLPPAKKTLAGDHARGEPDHSDVRGRARTGNRFQPAGQHWRLVREECLRLRRRARGQLAQLPAGGRVLPNRRKPIEIGGRTLPHAWLQRRLRRRRLGLHRRANPLGHYAGCLVQAQGRSPVQPRGWRHRRLGNCCSLQLGRSQQQRHSGRAAKRYRRHLLGADSRSSVSRSAGTRTTGFVLSCSSNTET